MIGRLVGWLSARLIDWLICRLLGCLISWLLERGTSEGGGPAPPEDALGGPWGGRDSPFRLPRTPAQAPCFRGCLCGCLRRCLGSPRAPLGHPWGEFWPSRVRPEGGLGGIGTFPSPSAFRLFSSITSDVSLVRPTTVFGPPFGLLKWLNPLFYHRKSDDSVKSSKAARGRSRDRPGPEIGILDTPNGT